MKPMRAKPHFDETGLLTDPRAWTPELAQELAILDGIEELSEQHWAFIRALRDYYETYRVAPPASKICRELHMQHGCGHALFNTCLSAWRIAGLPDPGEEAKSYLSAE